MTDPDPLRSIEDKRAQMDLGVMAHRVWMGAKEEGASDLQAWLTVCALFVGMFSTRPSDEAQEN